MRPAIAIRAVVRHALEFETWGSLDAQGLSFERASELMAAWFGCIAEGA